MALYRERLPQAEGTPFLTDGGLETTLIFHERVDLPLFAAFHLLRDDDGTERLRKYYATYAGLARERKMGLILESATWRASRNWGEQLGYAPDALAAVNRKAVELCEEIRAANAAANAPMVVAGCIGPRVDGYSAERRMGAAEAERYHAEQVQTFSATNADFLSVLTMTYADEAIGVSRAAQAHGMPVVISFTVETDGKLPSGETLQEAVERVDRETDGTPAYFMINCAHPTHFADALPSPPGWVERIHGIRANASALSHAELDEAEELDDGNPVELGTQLRQIQERLPHLNVLGGCCGTDHRHIDAIARAWRPAP